MKICIVFITVCLVALTLPMVASSPGAGGGVWPCGGNPNALTDEYGSPVWLPSSELVARATHRIEPEIPGSFQAHASVVVDVLIDETGKVTCVRTTSGHPLLREAAEKAALHWEFARFTAGKKPIAVFGHLLFHIEH